MYHYYCNRSKDNKVVLTSDEMSKHHDVTKLDATLDKHEEEMINFGYAVVDTKKVRKYLYYYKLVVDLIVTSQSSLI